MIRRILRAAVDRFDRAATTRINALIDSIGDVWASAERCLLVLMAFGGAFGVVMHMGRDTFYGGGR